MNTEDSSHVNRIKVTGGPDAAAQKGAAANEGMKATLANCFAERHASYMKPMIITIQTFLITVCAPQTHVRDERVKQAKLTGKQEEEFISIPKHISHVAGFDGRDTASTEEKSGGRNSRRAGTDIT